MFFILSKILILFILPLGICIIFSFINIKLKNKYISLLTFFLLYFLSMGNISKILVNKIEKPWIRNYPNDLNKADAIVVLNGGGPYIRGPKRIIEFGDQDRFYAGINLYKKGKAPKIIFTSTAVGAPINGLQLTSSNIYRRKAIKNGIPFSAIKSTNLVRNTYEEMLQIQKLFKKEGELNPKIILVTSAFHMTRAKNLFEKKGFSIIPFPVDFKTDFKNDNNQFFAINEFLPSVENLSQSTMVIKEIIGRLVYKFY